MNERNYAFDVLKFFMATFVVFIHVPTPYYNILDPIYRCAVPVFFIISGYFLYSEDSQIIFQERILKNINKVTKICLWATLLYIPFTIYSEKTFVIVNFHKLLKWIFFNDCPIGFHLWYIYAYLYVLFILYFVNKYYAIKKIFILIPFLLIFDLVLGKYSLLIWNGEISFIFLRNYLFVGLPYVLIGCLIKDFKYNIPQKAKTYFLLLIIFGITSILEQTLLNSINCNSYRNHYISTTPLSVFLILYALSKTIPKPNIISILGERYSLYISFILFVAIF